MDVPDEFHELLQTDEFREGLADMRARLDRLEVELRHLAAAHEEDDEESLAFLRWGVEQEAMDEDQRLLQYEVEDSEEFTWQASVRAHVRATYAPIVEGLIGVYAATVGHPGLRKPSLLYARHTMQEYAEFGDEGVFATIFIRSLINGLWVCPDGGWLRVVPKRSRWIFDEPGGEDHA